jgi:predicted SAM-dependent methyltransferase
MRRRRFSLLKKLAKNDVFYHAVDIDEEAILKVNKKASVNSLDNLITYNSVDEFINVENRESLNIIMSEVFEHIKLSENKKIIKKCLDNLVVNKMIITTPDKRFNTYYLMSEEDKRLDDHIFEMDDIEFKDYFDDLMSSYKQKYNYSFHKIGDKVDGIPTSQAVIIEMIS